MSSLAIGPTATTSTTIPTAGALTTTVGSPSPTGMSTLIGQATGFGELQALGSGSSLPWQALNGLPDPDGNGWCWDSTGLTGQQFTPQLWSGAMVYNVTSGSIVADLYARWSLYNSQSGAYITQGTLVLPQQTITTSAQSYTFSQYLNQIAPNADEYLYLDCWANITSNNTGSNTANLVIQQVSTTLAVINTWSLTYQALTPSQLATRYSFGSFCFHDGVNYLLTEKTIEAVPIKQTLFKIARFEGMKKTGEVTNERNITLKIRVLGSSRADLEAKLDALYQAFTLRQQQLTLHSVDSRYFVADCVGVSAALPAGTILSALVTATFVCQQPYAFGAVQESYTSHAQTATLISGQSWQFPNQQVSSDGTIFARPTLLLTNNLYRNTVSLTSALTSGTNYTSLSVSSIGTTIPSGTWLYLNDGLGHTQHIQTSAQANAGATAISVVSFNASVNYPTSSATVYQDHYISGFTLTQNPDGTTLSVTSLGFVWSGGSSITIISDPTNANGYTVICNASPSTLVGFSGLFPVLEPGVNTLGLQLTSYNAPNATLVATWSSRWLA